jgi:hypothetical protein
VAALERIDCVDRYLKVGFGQAPSVNLTQNMLHRRALRELKPKPSAQRAVATRRKRLCIELNESIAQHCLQRIGGDGGRRSGERVIDREHANVEDWIVVQQRTDAQSMTLPNTHTPYAPRISMRFDSQDNHRGAQRAAIPAQRRRPPFAADQKSL